MPRMPRRVFIGWLWWRLLGPEIPPRFPPDQEHPLRLPGRTLFVGDRELFVRETGPADGPPLVLIHGLGDDSLLVWHRMIPLLAARYRLIAVDQRNHGKSDRLRERYQIEQVADDVAGMLDALGVERAAVAGYSMGGMVAQSLAFRHPHRVEKLVLGATAACYLPGRGPWAYLSRLLGTLARAVERISPLEFALIRYRYLLRAGAVERRHARWLWNAQLQRDTNLYYEAAAATTLRFDSRPWVSHIECPALVIIPSRDQLMPPRAQYRLAALLADVQVAEIWGARHEAVLTHADHVARAIDAFLGGTPGLRAVAGA